MALSVHVAGLAAIKMNLGESWNALQTFGYTQDGANIVFQPFYQDVQGDQNGGDAGPPIEKVFMGEIAQVQLDFSKWDATLVTMLEKRFVDRGGSLVRGAPASAGTLVFPSAFTLIISGQGAAADEETKIYNFPRAVPDQPRQINKGTKYSRLSMSFTCFANTNGVLYTTNETVLVP